LTKIDFLQGEFGRLLKTLKKWYDGLPDKTKDNKNFAIFDKSTELFAKPFSRYGYLCSLCLLCNSDSRALCVQFLKHESERQTVWHANTGGGNAKTRSVGGGTLTSVFRMLMYFGFDEASVLTKCPDALRTELLRGIKAHKRSLIPKMNVGLHPSGIAVVLG
jgi:hypothetical protein